jgi:DNA-directed RNA polymerase subunit K/omega
MLYPTIAKLTKGKYNRYQLALATSKCARIITDEYVAQRKYAEKNATGNKDLDRAQADAIVDHDYRDKKAVKIAIDKISDGEYVIIDKSAGGISADGGVKPEN